MTTIGIKQDADLILSHLRSLKDTSWIAESQSRWPDFLYHFTDIHNAIEILRKGELICRSELESTGSLATDIASPEVISSTSDRWKDYVRFYFRPKTPTQYRNEGFRPRNQRELGGAHCPVPIFFLFDIKPIVSREETKFSDGNLAADANVDSTAAFFTSLPFEKIYHERSLWGLDEGEKRKIIFHRHAEVIVPQAVELSSLKWIWCRSRAEFETFIHLLPSEEYIQWSRKIGAGNRSPLFFGEWSFVKDAKLDSDQVALTFNPISKTPGPFHVELEIHEHKTGSIFRWESDDFMANSTLTFSLSHLAYPDHYMVRLLLDSDLAYENVYIDDSDLPF